MGHFGGVKDILVIFLKVFFFFFFLSISVILKILNVFSHFRACKVFLSFCRFEWF
jgi:hypothetical protein